MMSNNAKEALRRGDAATAEGKIGTVKILCILGFVNVAFWLLMAVVYVISMILMSMWFVSVVFNRPSRTFVARSRDRHSSISMIPPNGLAVGLKFVLRGR
jgi:hypothetical protein